ncbi:MAG: PQQ-binding-like beta-propeller repeat protein, partial [Terriglobia bacterium]
VLHRLSRASILTTLETGAMKMQGAGLTQAQREAVAKFLSDVKTSHPKLQAGFCAANPRRLADDPGWNAWGANISNSRSEPAPVAVLNRSTVPRLKLKWAFGFPGAWATFGQPTIFGGRVFAGSEDGHVYSLDAKTGCIYWIYKSPSTVKTAVPIGLGGRVAFFGDVDGNVYAVNAATGSLIWKERVDPHPASRITGSPALFGNKLYVPVSSGEEGAALDPKYPCCTFRGSVVALDARTGRHIWQAYTIPQPAHLTGRKNSAGAPLSGPSGGSVWSTPTLDPKHRTLYVATGNSYSDPPSPYTDAVIAFSMDTGKRLWFRQLTPDDVWNSGCIAPNKANCPQKPGKDYDFGSPPILRRLPNGHRVLIVPQKSGVIYALLPGQHGRIAWETRIGKGGPLGGVEWGGAAGANLAFFPLSDWDPVDAAAGGGLFALQISTGKKIWDAPPPRPDCLKQVGCSAAQSAPVTTIPGVVFSGSEDGHLRAYDARTGKVIWDFETARQFHTVNGLVARGGSMNGTGPAVANGMIYVDSGYTNEMAGNVLLAFSVDGR